jgi:hypothetical protein
LEEGWVMMLQLSIDYNDGTGFIPCPTCGQPLVLAYEKLGRLLVGYDNHIVYRRGPALLVCPVVDCPHQERIRIVNDSLDAIAFNPAWAAWYYDARERERKRSISEMRQMVNQYRELFEQTGNRKLPSLVRYWQQRFDRTLSWLRSSVQQAHEKQEEIHLTGPDLDEQGYIKEIKKDGLLLKRTETNEEVYLRAGQLHSAAVVMHDPGLFDEEVRDNRYAGIKTVSSPSYFVVIDGHTFAMEHSMFYGMVRLNTKDREVAHKYGFIEVRPGHFVGEITAAVVQRAYRRIRLCHVKGCRVAVKSDTTDPEVFQVHTKNQRVADALNMPDTKMLLLTRRGPQKWRNRFFHRSEVERMEEIIVPVKLKMPRDRLRKRRWR